MNGFFSDNFANMCESEGYDIAPIPEEIVSQQEERNETTSMPEVTYTPTFTYTTPDVAPWTITFDGETAVTLPAIAEETVLTDAAPTLGGKKSFVWQCAAGLATVLLVIW